MSRFGGGPYHNENAEPYGADYRESGARRKKLAGYLRQANELRQTYVQSWRNDDQTTEDDFTRAAVSTKGDEQLILFPSYAKHHIRTKPTVVPGTIQEHPGNGRDVRDTAGAGDAEWWKQEWEKHESDKAVVDVDVRGWVFTPHNGQMTRKQRLMMVLARQLMGLPSSANKGSVSSTPTATSRANSPTRKIEEEMASREAAAIVQRGEAEASIAQAGGFSEQPSSTAAASNSLNESVVNGRAAHGRQGSLSTLDSLTTVNTTVSQSSALSVAPSEQSAQALRMNSAELAAANANLLARLKPFMANPTVSTTITVFFYNERTSRQKTVTTDSYGHFNFRAPLDFIPTHVRVLASEHLSVSEEVNLIHSKGVSLISDVDDTVRHSAITKGAREIFRNAFIRELGDLTIEGVREWYNGLKDLGVHFHYVSNSPWQLFPVISNFFSIAGLPQGSFHLKQYSGMLQGIFEPVAERKKATLTRLFHDFPDRKFILVGDSGEADLEVYKVTVEEYPGRVLAVFIRDVTTTIPQAGFFDHGGPKGSSGTSTPRGRQSPAQSVDGRAQSGRSATANAVVEDDPDMRTAIAASLQGGRSRNGVGDTLDRSKRPSKTSNLDDDEKNLRAAIAASLKGRHSRNASIDRSARTSNARDDNEDNDEHLKAAIAASLKTRHTRHRSVEELAEDISRAYDLDGDDEQLRAAISASLRDMEEESELHRQSNASNRRGTEELSPTSEVRPPLPSRPSQTSGNELGDLIDLSDGSELAKLLGGIDGRQAPPVPAKPTTLGSQGRNKPPPPSKPVRLRSDSSTSRGSPGPPPSYDEITREWNSSTRSQSPPVVPRKPSIDARPSSPSPLSQVQNQQSWPARAASLATQGQRQRPQQQLTTKPSRSALYTKNALGVVTTALPCTRPLLSGLAQNSGGGSSSNIIGRPQLTRSPQQSSSALGLAAATLMSPAAPAEARGMHSSRAGSGSSNRQQQQQRGGSSISSTSSSGTSSSGRALAPPPPPRKAFPITRSVANFAATQASSAATNVREYWNRPSPTNTTGHHNDDSSDRNTDDSDSGSLYPQQQQQQQLQQQVQQLNKREQQWKARWAKAKEVMDRDGVALRTWRVGGDVQRDSEELVREELARQRER